LQWLQDPSEINEDNLNNILPEAQQAFQERKLEYLKEKMNELPMSSKTKNIRDLYRKRNEFKNGYQQK
jgi:hypothetical protein